jgi:hypothetical protein
MAETINIENSRYEFEAMLIARVADPNSAEKFVYKSVPITKSSIKFLEIRNDLVNFGYTGVITFTNYFGIIQKMGAYNVSNEAPYLYIRFRNLDFAQAGRTAPPVYLLASLGKSFETSNNSIDKHISFEFEEFIVSKLKRTSVSSITLDNLGSSLGVSDSSSGTDDWRTKSPANLIGYLISRGTKTTGITTSVAISGTPTDSTIFLSDTGIDESSATIFDAIRVLSSYLSYKPSGDVPSELADFASPGILTVENTADNKARQFVIKSLADDIKNFFTLIKTQKSSDKISNYLTEKFSTSLSKDSKTYGDNFIHRYNIMRVNYEDVYENKWINIECTCGPNDCTINDIYPYQYLRAAFERLFTAPYATNIPTRTEDINNKTVKTTKYSVRNIDTKLAVAYGTNRVLKSFIFDNTAMTFRVKGQPYRTPGKFIHIQADDNNDTGEINGYWYIISLNHVFENDIYFNDYVCVRLYSSYGKLSEIPQRPVGFSGYNPASSGAGGGGYPPLPTNTPGGKPTQAGDIIPEAALPEAAKYSPLAQEEIARRALDLAARAKSERAQGLPRVYVGGTPLLQTPELDVHPDAVLKEINTDLK